MLQDTEFKATVAANLTELRKRKGWTQAELAERLNYSDKAVSKWERGESLPDVMVIKQLADLYEVPVDYLLEQIHGETQIPVSRRKRRNRALITAISVMTVWLIASIVYFSLHIAGTTTPWAWLSFAAAVPASCVVMLIFTALWWNKQLLFTTVSVLIWSLLGVAFLVVLFAAQRSLWLIFLIGIPSQVITVLWAGLKKESKEK